jgi:penicillin-binding protein 1C
VVGGFDGRITRRVGRRPDGAPVRLVGRTAAAPILFDAFARTGKIPAALPSRRGRAGCSNAVPLPLRRFRPSAN